MKHTTYIENLTRWDLCNSIYFSFKPLNIRPININLFSQIKKKKKKLEKSYPSLFASVPFLQQLNSTFTVKIKTTFFSTRGSEVNSFNKNDLHHFATNWSFFFFFAPVVESKKKGRWSLSAFEKWKHVYIALQLPPTPCYQINVSTQSLRCYLRQSGH